MSGDEDSMDMEHRYAKTNQPRGFPSVAQVVGIWREKFELGTLNESHFKEHWRLYVPQVLCLDPGNSSFDRVFDEENVLFAPLEQFICGDGNASEVLERIQRLDEPSTVCGKVFKMSEPTYHCRECGTDPTCVLCVECFKKSAHKNHKYKMSMSNGGGCCDCGDTEAWKNDPYCSVHIAGTLPAAASDGGESSSAGTDRGNFPDDMARRTRVIFGAVLRYAYQLLKYDDSPELPSDLRLKEIEEDPLSFLDTPDTYCTVLYNDETHTFDNVITTLSKVIKCNQRDAMDYVTNIDREGRAVVKISTFQHCTELKNEVERITSRNTSKPLKVLVKHSHVIAHQLYAIKLLARVQKILSYSKHFRRIFSEIVLERKSSSGSSPSDISILEGVFRADSSLWKSARVHWHRLFISGMLKEYEHKKEFARLFTKNYGSIMQDFIRDDHDHSFSVASLAVQIFTVPTIAHYLIAYQDVLFVLLNTFLSECNANQKDGKLEFQRNEHSSAVTFKRAQYIIFDLHYLLSTVPERWTDELRKGFNQGLSLFLRLLCLMQGMDAVTRQVGQHMEYEPEWETAFNLHIKLSPVVTMMIKWCGTDKKILTKAYRATLKKLHDNPCADLSSAHCLVQELADHSTSCVVYDVSTQPVSIHLPLSRFLAGLHVQLERFGLNFYSPEFQFTPKQTLEQIVEPVLRTQVMIAQVHANLWRRNGYSILHQIYFYHNVKCRNEMLNKDIIMLQIGASLIESNDFLIHLLNKFNLLNWADADFEGIGGSTSTTGAATTTAAIKSGSAASAAVTSSTTGTAAVATASSPKKAEEESIRQTITLVEEFLTLLVTVVSERYVVGIGKVTEKDCVKKEIMQQLCIRPLSHSELSKVLPDSDHNDVTVDSIIDEIATFEKPASGNGKGMYKLKPQYYDQYNVFYYHYTKEELSRSEEAQRARRKQQGLLDCCPPPTLPPLTESFVMLVNLLQCDVMFYLMQLVLRRACDLKARSFSESQLHRVLHLIGYALHEEESGRLDYFVFTERCKRWMLLPYLEELHGSSRVEAHRDLIKWTINKYKYVSRLSLKIKRKSETRSIVGDSSSTAREEDDRRKSATSEAVGSENRTDEKMELGEEEGAGGQPSNADESADKQMSWEYSAANDDDDAQKKEKERIAKLAAERRMKIMAQMSSAQQSFIKEHAQLYEEATKNDSTTASSTSGGGGAGESMAWEASDANVEFPIAVGPNQTHHSSPDPGYVCILCQEHQIVRTDAPAMVYGAFVQKSSVLANELHSPAIEARRSSSGGAGNVGDDDAVIFLTGALSPSPFTSICGHVMHSTCWEKYFSNISTKENRRPYRLRQPISFDVEKNEFLCPLCESLNNTILPVLPPLKNMTGSSARSSSSSNTKTDPPSSSTSLDSQQFSFDAWLKSIIVATDKKQQEIMKRKLTWSSSTQSRSSAETCDTSASGIGDRLIDDSESTITDLTVSASNSDRSADRCATDQPADENRAAVPSDEQQRDVDDEDDDEDLSSLRETDQMEILLYNSVADSSASLEATGGSSGVEQTTVSSSCPVLSPTLTTMIQKYCKSVCVKGLGLSSDVERNSVLYCWKSCAYTIHVVEMLLRSENRPLLRYLPTRQKQCVKALIRLSALQEICGNQRVINNYAITLLGVVFDNSHVYSDTCILDWDPFGMLVSLVMCLPSLFFMAAPSPLPCGGLLELYTLKLMLISTVAQILIGLRAGTLESAADDVSGDDEASAGENTTECLKRYLKIIADSDANDGSRDNGESVDTAALWKRITKLCVPFLRCCCLFFRFLTNVPAADCLSQVNGDTYENMCRYLGLPTGCDQLLNDPFVIKVFKKWTANWRRKQSLHNSSIRFESYLKLGSLIQLPEDYSELINSVSMFTCPNSDREDSRNPTVCLVCGTILCSQSYCCQKELNGAMVGACAFHATHCGAGAGIFLRMRECEILLLSCLNRGCFLSPPYVDEYGETDQGLRRGNPLKLCHKRYKKLENIWLSHSIHEEVSRSLESTHSLAVTQWQHL